MSISTASDAERYIKRGYVRTNGARPARQGRAFRWGLSALFAAAVTLAIIQYSLRHGKLILFPFYDDVGYLADGLFRLQTLYDFGADGLASTYRTLPPHSPYSTFMAIVGFALFGYHDWAPYVTNSLLALGYFLLADRLLRGAALWQKAVCFAFISTIPFVGMAVHEFRPDHAVALFTAAGVLTLLWGPFVYGSRRRQIAAGVWFGLAMLTKPPVFPQTLVIGGAALVLATLSDWLASGRPPHAGSTARAWLAVLVPFALIPLPHYIHDGRAIFSYIHEILFGSFKESYQNNGTSAEQITYYLTGQGGRIMLGGHWKLLLALLLALGVAVVAQRRRADIVRATAMLLIVLLAWLIPTAIRTKQEFFGLTFDTLLTGLVVFLLGRLLTVERKRGGWGRWVSAILVLATVYGIHVFQWPVRSGNLYTGWQENRREIVYGVFHSIVAHSTFGGADVAPTPDRSIPDEEKNHSPTPTVVLCGVGDVNDDVLKYLALKEQVSMKVWFNPGAKTPQEIIHDFDGADFIIAAESNPWLIPGFLPSTPWQDTLLAAVRSRRDFKQIGEWTFRKAGRSFYLFQRSEFRGFTPVSGLGTNEGPYPQLHLGILRWGYGPASTLKVKATTDGAYELYWKARSDFQGEVVTVMLDGKQIAQESVPGSYTQFTPTSVPLSLTAGEHEIELRYSKWHKDADRPMAVLFEILQFNPLTPS
ncbi:MAG: hypothetical protein JWL69_1799 [Phycisphaerales bacterium]|nr:hypothetical protein [Phycisphaerales bacterium]